MAKFNNSWNYGFVLNKNGMLLIGASSTNPQASFLTSSGGTLTFSFGPGSIDIELNTGFSFFNPLLVSYGGTGRTILTRFGVLIGEGSRNINVTAPGTNGQLLIASTTGDPIFATITSTGGTLTFVLGPNSINIEALPLSFTFLGSLIVGHGGTGLTVLTKFGVLLGEGSNQIDVTAAGTNGQLLVAATNADPAFSTITSTGGTLTFTAGLHSLNLDVTLSSNPFFSPLQVPYGGTGQTVLTTSGVLLGEGSNAVNVTAAGTDGQVLIGSSTGDPSFSTLSSFANTIAFTPSHDGLNIDLNPPVIVSFGGTGRTILTTHGVLLGEGSNSINVTAAGTNGQVLLGATGGDPAFATITSTGRTLTFTFGPNSLNIGINFTGNSFFNPLQVGNGGTGRTVLTVSGVLLGEGASPVDVTAAGTDGQVLTGSSVGDPQFSTISSSLGTLAFVPGHNSLNIDLKVPVLVSFGGTGRTILTASGVLVGEGSNRVNVTAAGTNGQLLIAATTADPAFATVTSTGNTLTFTFGPNSLNMEVNLSGNPFLTPLQVPFGGTGRTILTTSGVLLGEGSNRVNVTAAGTDGQVFLGSSTGDPRFNTLSSSLGTLAFVASHGSLNIDLNVPVLVPSGGTGRTILTTFGVLIGEGSNAINVTAPGTNGQALLASTTGDPKFSTITSSGSTIAFVAGPNSLNLEANLSGSSFFNPLQVGNGGTGRTILTAFGVLLGEGSNQVNVTAAGTDGQVLIGSSTGDPSFNALSSSLATLVFTAGHSSLNIDLAIPVKVPSGGTGRTLLTTFGVLLGEGSNNINVTAAGTHGQTLIASTTGDPKFSTITSSGGTLTFTSGPNSLNIDVNLYSNTFFNPVQVQFGGTGRTLLTTSGVLLGEGSNQINVTAAGTDGQVFLGSSTGDPRFNTLTSSLATLFFTPGHGSLNIDLNIPVTVPSGGTGRTLLTTFGVLIGEGSNRVNVTAAGTNGQLLMASTTGDPKFSTITSTGGTIAFTVGPNSLNLDVNLLGNTFFNPVLVPFGGTGRTVLTTFGVLLGEGSNNVNVTAAGTNGQVLIASTTGDPLFATITSSNQTLSFVAGANTLNLDVINPTGIAFQADSGPLVAPTAGVFTISGNSPISTTGTASTLSIQVGFIPVGSGGTGRSVLTTFGVLLGEGSNNINVTAPGTNGQVLIASTTGDPKFTTITSTGNTVTFTFGPNSLNIEALPNIPIPLPLSQGGTGRTIFTTFGVLIGEGSNPLNATAAGTNGQVLIASTTGDPKFATITSTGNTVTFGFGPNSLNIDVLNPNFATVQIGGTGRTILTTFGVLIGEGSNQVNVTAAGTNGQVLMASTTGDPKFGTITSTGGTLTFSFGPNSLNVDINLGGTFFNPLSVQNGGTGQTILTTFGVLIGEGSNDVNVTAAGTSGQVLIASTSGDPAFATISSTAGTILFTAGPNSLNLDINLTGSFFNPLSVQNGGTGLTVLTTFGVLLGEGSNDVNVTAAGTNGQVLIASTTGDPAFAAISSTGGTIIFVAGPNSLNMEINLTGSFFNPLSVQNGGTGQTILTTFGVLIGEGSNSIDVTDAGTNGQVLVAATGADPAFATISSTGNTVAFTYGPNSLNLEINITGSSFFNPVSVQNGGTGQTILTRFGVLLGEGSNDVNVTAAGTDGQLLIASSTGDPQFATLSSSSGTIVFVAGHNSLDIGLNVPISIGIGGTGRTILTTFGVLIGEGSNQVNVTAAGTNGQVLIASTTGDPKFATLTSSGGTITFVFGPNSINIETIDIDFATVAIGGTGRTILTTFGVLIGEGSNNVNVTAAGTNGQVLIASTTGDPKFATITSTGGSLTFTFGPNSINIETISFATVALGGTGRTILTTFGVLIGEGSNQVNVTAAGTNGQVLIASTTGDPAFATITSTGGTVAFVFGPNSLNMEVPALNIVPVTLGGTGLTILTKFGVLIGEGSNQVNVTAAGTSGQLLIASTTGDPAFATLSSTGGTLSLTFGPNSLNIDVVISAVASVQLGGTGRTILTTFGVLLGEGSNNINVTAAGTNGQTLLAATGADPAFATITSTGGTLTFKFGPNSLNVDIVPTILAVPFGGTGRTVLTLSGVLIGEGSNPINVTAAGTDGQVLLGSSTGDPRFNTITSTGATLAFTRGHNSLNVDINGAVDVGFGGTNRTILTTFGVLLGEGSNSVNVTAAGTDGQVLIASTGADPQFATITSTGNTLTFFFGNNSLDIELVTNIPFNVLVPTGGTGRTVLTTFGVLIGEGSNSVDVTAAGTNGQVLLAATGADPRFSTLTSSGGTIAFTAGANSLNIDTSGQSLFNILSVSAGTTTITSSFSYYAVDSSGGTVTLNFPNSVASNFYWTIKDSTGYSITNPIVIRSLGGSVKFDGETIFNLINPFGALNIVYNTNSSRYEIF